ncbi:MAG: thymidine phosphorylase [Anaerolineae bacterium]|nr:thymidine phosphorylase [Anaerolineae bacterium]
MNSLSIIEKKRDGESLTAEEIRFFVDGYTRSEIPDYQAAAWCMAVYLNGMSRQETADLTLAMAESGEMLDLSGLLDTVIDKHSSGGVGDKTTLVVLPLVVACGVPVAKMSGRGLSFSGGTLDKLESIDGYNTKLTRDQFTAQIRKHGIVLCGQTADLAPADAKLYALRDVTGTVPSKPLIAGSIMSKKIAAGAEAIVLDVKCGRGAFMQSLDDARDLAQIMVDIGASLGRKVTALISDMSQPLGCAVGNALEVREAIDTLHGHGPADFIEHCLIVAGHMLRLAGKSQTEDLSDNRPILEEKLHDGSAWEVFRRLVNAQGGNVDQIDHPDRLPAAPVIIDVPAPTSGQLSAIDAREIGIAALELGAGRHKKEDPIDHAVGLVIHHKVGDTTQAGDTLFTVHARNAEAAQQASRRVLAAHAWAEPVDKPLLVYDIISSP